MWRSENSSMSRGMRGIKILIEAPSKRFPHIPFAHLNNGLGQSMGNLHSGTIDHCQGHHVLVRTVVLLATATCWTSESSHQKSLQTIGCPHTCWCLWRFVSSSCLSQTSRSMAPNKQDNRTLPQTTQKPIKHGTCRWAFESKCALETIIGKS